MTNWIGEYEQLTEMQTVGSGSARWCIARRMGERFFVKEFLSPVYPSEDRPSALTRKQRKRCETFEGQKKRLYAALACVIGETLVPVLDFFRHEGRYYAISEEVPRPHVTGETAGHLSPKETRRLLYSLALCLQRLHTQGVVHADLKPEHLMLLGEAGHYDLRLIDLDSGFLEDEPPVEQKEIEGDPVYLAPETFLCLMGEKATLSSKVDTFALGILIHRMWTGELPVFDTEQYTYVYEAALSGGDIRLLPTLPLAYRSYVQQMLLKNPADRPKDEDIVRMLSVSKTDQSAGFVMGSNLPLNGLSRFMKK